MKLMMLIGIILSPVAYAEKLYDPNHTNPVQAAQSESVQVNDKPGREDRLSQRINHNKNFNQKSADRESDGRPLIPASRNEIEGIMTDTKNAVFQIASEPTREDINKLLKSNPEATLRLRIADRSMTEAMQMPLPNKFVKPIVETEIYRFGSEEIPTISLMQDNPSTVEFVDVTNEAWPIGDAKSFDGMATASVAENGASNALYLTTDRISGISYLSIFLQGMTESIQVRLVVGDGNYHTRKVIKLERLAPTTEISFSNMDVSLSSGIQLDNDLKNAVQGMKPSNYKQVGSSHPDVVAWESNDDLILRTKLNLLSPSTLVPSVSGNFGFKAMRVPKTTQVRFLSGTGQIIEVKIGGRVDG